MILRLTLDLPEEQAYIKITRLMGRTLLEHLRADEQDIDEVELIVGELCGNVVRHARSTENHFQVVIEYYADQVLMTGRDQGPGFAMSEIAPVGTERTDFDSAGERIGGYGLRLIELLSDRVEFQQTDPIGTTVRAEKRIRYRAPADAAHAEFLSRTVRAGSVSVAVGPGGVR